MAFKSKAQARKLAMMAGEGTFSMEKFREFAHATKNYKRLPEHVKRKKK